MNISVVVPVYNGQATITELTERLGKVLSAMTEAFEVILVCDGSPDDSWRVIEQLTARYPWAVGIQLMRNYGQHNALLCGVRAARYELTVTLDDDLQNPPEEIPMLAAKLAEGYDVVFGVPKKMSQNWWCNLTSVLVKKLVGLVMGERSISDITSYRIFHTYLREAFQSYQGPELLLDYLLTWGASRFGTVQVEKLPRKVGESNCDFGKLLRLALTLLTGYTTLPLRFASILGFIFTVLGALLLIYVIAIYFSVGSEPGFPFLASAISLFSGVQLFALGIMGEYIARVFDRTQGRPSYQVLTTVGCEME